MQEERDEQCALDEARLQIASVALGVFTIFLGTFVCRLVLAVIVSCLPKEAASADWVRFGLNYLPMYLCGMPLSLLLFRLGRAESPHTSEKLSPLVFAALLTVCFGLTYAGDVFGSLLNAVIGAISGHAPENALETATLSAPLWSNFIFMGLVAPIMEELFYRKAVIDRLRRFGELPTLLISGILFGLVHGNFYQFFYATAVGMLFGYIYLRTGRILYTVILHAAINMVGGVYTPEMLKRLDMTLFLHDPAAALAASPTGALMYFIYVGFLVLSCVLSLVSVVYLWLRWRRPFVKGTVVLTPRAWVRVLLVNPALWLLLCLVSVLFVTSL